MRAFLLLPQAGALLLCPTAPPVETSDSKQQLFSIVITPVKLSGYTTCRQHDSRGDY